MEEFKFTLDPEKFKKNVQEKLNEQPVEEIQESDDRVELESDTDSAQDSVSVTEEKLPEVVVFDDEIDLNQQENNKEEEKIAKIKAKEEKKELKKAKREQKKAARKEKNKHKGNNILFYIAFGLVFIIMAVALSLTVFFNIETITVENSTVYSKDEVIAACGVDLGENVFLISSETIENNICTALPYIKNVDVKKRLDNTLILTVEETYDYMVVDSNSGFAILSPEKKVLRFIDGSYPKNLVHVFGLKITNVYPGEAAQFKQANAEKALDELIPVLIKTGFDKVKSISVNDLSSIKFIYNDRICVNVGTQDDLEYKLSFAKQAIASSIEADAVGTLNLSQLSGKNREIQFRKEDLYAVKKTVNDPVETE